MKHFIDFYYVLCLINLFIDPVAKHFDVFYHQFPHSGWFRSGNAFVYILFKYFLVIAEFTRHQPALWLACNTFLFVVTSNFIPSSKPLLNPKHHHPSFPLWCGDFTRITASHPPFNFYFGPNIAQKTSRVFETSCINHIKQLGNKGGGWQRQTNTTISHCTSLVSRHGWRRACLLRNISHTVKAKRTYRRRIQQACKQARCCVVIYNKHRSKSTKWTSVSESTMWHNLFSSQSPHSRSSHTRRQDRH